MSRDTRVTYVPRQNRPQSGRFGLWKGSVDGVRRSGESALGDGVVELASGEELVGGDGQAGERTAHEQEGEESADHVGGPPVQVGWAGRRR